MEKISTAFKTTLAVMVLQDIRQTASTSSTSKHAKIISLFITALVIFVISNSRLKNCRYSLLFTNKLYGKATLSKPETFNSKNLPWTEDVHIQEGTGKRQKNNELCNVHCPLKLTVYMYWYLYVPLDPHTPTGTHGPIKYGLIRVSF